MRRDEFQAGDTIRFQVQDRDLGNGSSWALVTSKKSDDIYLNHREGARWVHLTSHDSGVSQYTLTDRAASIQPGTARHFGITIGNSSLAPGWHVKMRIIIPHSSLQLSYTESVRKKELIAVPISADSSRNTTQISIILREKGSESLIFNNSYQLAGFDLSSGRQRIVIAESTMYELDPHESFKDVIQEVKQVAIAANFSQAITRFALSVVDSEMPNTKTEIELAVSIRP